MYENIIEWLNVPNGLRIRVWTDATATPVRPSTDRAMMDGVLGNYLEITRPVTPNDCRDLAEQVAKLLMRHTVAVNGVEVTVNGSGSIYYPVWP